MNECRHRTVVNKNNPPQPHFQTLALFESRALTRQWILLQLFLHPGGSSLACITFKVRGKTAVLRTDLLFAWLAGWGEQKKKQGTRAWSVRWWWREEGERQDIKNESR